MKGLTPRVSSMKRELDLPKVSHGWNTERANQISNEKMLPATSFLITNLRLLKKILKSFSNLTFIQSTV